MPRNALLFMDTLLLLVGLGAAVFEVRHGNVNSHQLALAALGALLAGLLRGFTGFGSAMVLFPIVSFLFGAKVAVAVVEAVDWFGSLALLWGAFRRRQPRALLREVGPVAAGAFVGVPIGVMLLLVVNDAWLRAIAASLILSWVIFQVRRRHHNRSARPWVKQLVGFVAGVSGGATTLSGPPVALFWLGEESDHGTVRDNVIVFFGASGLLSMAWFAASGLYTGHVIGMALALFPIFIISARAGEKKFLHASERSFRQVALALIALIAAMSGVAAIANLNGWF